MAMQGQIRGGGIRAVATTQPPAIFQVQLQTFPADNPMILNAMFPTRHIGNDPGAIKAWASAAEELDFHTIEVADHVFGAEPRDGWQPIYDATQPFHETFVTLGFLAVVT